MGSFPFKKKKDYTDGTHENFFRRKIAIAIIS